MAHDQATKTRTLKLYAEHGLAHAHHETGIPKSTIRDWARAAKVTTARADQKTARANDANRLRWNERRLALKHELGDVVEAGISRARIELEDGSAREGKDAMLAAAVAIDKAEGLDVHADPEQHAADAAAVAADVERDEAEGLRLLPGGKADEAAA